MKTAIESIFVHVTVVRYVRAFVPAIILGGAMGLWAGCVTETTTRRVSLPPTSSVTPEIATATKTIPVLPSGAGANAVDTPLSTTTTVNNNPPS